MFKTSSVVKSCLLSGLILLLASCGGGTKKTPLTPEQVDKKFSSGVVLIQNTHYFSITFNNGVTFYFSGLDKDGKPTGFALEVEDVEPVTLVGTGFFVSKDGTIATNSHVASPSVDVSSARSSIIGAFRTMANECSNNINDINETMGTLRLAIMAADTYSEEQEYRERYNELSQKRDELQELVNSIQSLGEQEYTVNVHCNIGIAYNNTHVTSISDFSDCVNIANDPEHDLALIQLKSKVTPEGKHIFKIPGGKKTKSSEESSSENNAGKKNSVSVGKKLYMIGFNRGLSVAITNEGIKAQVMSGEVSQDTDNTKIMYTIPTLGGSSGSPVIDEYGRLIAINFAGFKDTQNFNYGVKVSHLKKLMDNLGE